MRCTYFPKQESKFTHPENMFLSFSLDGWSVPRRALGNARFWRCWQRADGPTRVTDQPQCWDRTYRGKPPYPMLAGGLRLKAYLHRKKLKNSTALPACNASLAQSRLNTCVPHSEALSSLSISFPLCVTRAIKLHFMVTSKHTLLRSWREKAKTIDNVLLNLEKMEHTLEDGTVCIEDKLLQNHNVNSSKDKFPGLDSTKIRPSLAQKVGEDC